MDLPGAPERELLAWLASNPLRSFTGEELCYVLGTGRGTEILARTVANRVAELRRALGPERVPDAKVGG